jgi:protein-disulfide isomerase
MDARIEHSFGPDDAPVTVIEYGDFECPYCAAAAPVLHELVETGGDIRLVFRHFPLFEVHPHALTAALAAESCTASGTFWSMHDALFAHQAHLDDASLRRYAASVGADPDLAVGLPAQVFAPTVQADYAAGVQAGVRGTPTLFINGAHYQGRTELAALRRAVAASRRGEPG